MITVFTDKLYKFAEQAKIAKAVASIQAAMLKKRAANVCGRWCAYFAEKCRAEYVLAVKKYRHLRELWVGNHYFTFWFICGNGKNIAKKQVQKKHLRYAFTGLASLVGGVVLTMGVLAHFAYLNYEQKQELQEYKNTKAATEQKIKELEQVAENNQKQLADLSKLEDQVRQQLEQGGGKLPPKSSLDAARGRGGAAEGLTPATMTLDKEQMISREAQLRKNELEKLLDYIKLDNHRKEFTPNAWPTYGGEITSRFGGRPDPFGGYGSDWHPGIDIANDYGAPVYAGASGYVEQAGWNGGYGRYVKVSHDYGYQTAYGHMSSIAVSSGEYVKKGQLIGTVGSSGYSTGPHLHYEVLLNGRQIDPLALL